MTDDIDEEIDIEFPALGAAMKAGALTRCACNSCQTNALIATAIDIAAMARDPQPETHIFIVAHALARLSLYNDIDFDTATALLGKAISTEVRATAEAEGVVGNA